MVKSRTKYVGAGTTILTLMALLGWFVNSDNFDVEYSGDIYCAEDCTSYFNITSKYYNYYLYNKEGVKLGFIPEIDEYYICKPDKRCKHCGGCPAGYREIDFVSPYTSRYKYVYKFPKGVKQEFMIIGKKELNQTVKWSLDAVNEYIDPAWKGFQIDSICDYETVTTPVTMLIKKNQTFSYKYEEINNKTKKNTTQTGYYTVAVTIGEYIHYSNESICNEVGLIINNEFKLHYDKYNTKCKLDGNVISCDMCPDKGGVSDGNCDGKLKTGESGFTIDLNKADWKEFKIKQDSSNYKELIKSTIENV